MRLHLIKSEPSTSPLDIQMGLEQWREINKDPNRWAIFEAVQFKHTRMVHVRWGYIYCASKERAIQRITFSLNGDGSVHVSRHTHN